jgi:hypothetical protein
MVVASALQLGENRVTDWGASDWFTRSSARNTSELLRQELAAKLDMPRRPFDSDESFGEGLKIHLGPHAHGCQVSFTGGIRNIGR